MASINGSDISNQGLNQYIQGQNGNGGGAAVNSAIQGVGSEFQTLGNSFTPQNNFQAGLAPITQQNFGNAINGSLGLFGQNYANQNALAGQLQSQAVGAGPNPAQNMLNQATNQNIQQNAGMIASQKGINPALAQRMAAENAGNMNQQAAGQAATMNSQQQLNAQGALGGLYGQLGNQQNTLQSTLQNAQAAQNNAIVSSANNMNTLNQATSAQNAKADQGGLGGLGGAVGAIAAMFNQGGMVQNMADGGPIISNWGFNSAPMGDTSGAQSAAGQYLNDNKSSNPLSGLTSMFSSDGGDSGAGAGALAAMASGGKVPGKAPVAGNSPKNDNVPAMLSPGEVVIPRSVMNSPNAPQNAAKFVAAVLAKKGLKKGLVS